MKLEFNKWVDKYFEPLTKNCYTSIYEKVEMGFAPSDLSHYYMEDLEEEYQEYLNQKLDQYEE